MRDGLLDRGVGRRERKCETSDTRGLQGDGEKEKQAQSSWLRGYVE